MFLKKKKERKKRKGQRKKEVRIHTHTHTHTQEEEEPIKMSAVSRFSHRSLSFLCPFFFFCYTVASAPMPRSTAYFMFSYLHCNMA